MEGGMYGHMNVCMDVWMMNVWMDGRQDGWMVEYFFGFMDGLLT
jgi:hypothetical protein